MRDPGKKKRKKKGANMFVAIYTNQPKRKRKGESRGEPATE